MIGVKPKVFLLSDFGNCDHYVAVMKAVILQRCPDVEFVDITHQVEPQGVEQGAYLLESTWPWLPEGSVVLAVVDPGVGSNREAAVFFHEGKCVVGPNNGLLGFLPRDLEGRTLDRPEFWMENVSATFHGRDVFAPCAAYLAGGGHWKHLGISVASPLRIADPENWLDAKGSGINARIIHFDHFGNAVTNLKWSSNACEGMGTMRVHLPGGREIIMGRTYADVVDGNSLAYAGSTGRLEIAVRNGNAKEALELSLGDIIRISG